ncbi:MAG: hypothetical protein IPF68_13120 [Bacteroidales bacterium]|nr:hypothetical protein [Bacteroidales bacterium]
MQRQVIPIFGLLEGDNQVIGTAIILKCGLMITAAHTFYEEIKEGEVTVEAGRKNEIFEIAVDEKKYTLGEPIYEMYSLDFSRINDEIYHDLTIYKMPDGLINESDLILSDDCAGYMVMKGYPAKENNLDTTFCTIANPDFSVRNYRKTPDSRKKFNNCFHIHQSISHGYSGGPVLCDGINVFGMIVYGDPNPATEGGTTAIKAEYIKNIIRRFT